MGRGSQDFDTMDSWLGHKPRSGNSNMLKGWKKKPGKIETWMHVKRLPMALWQHPFPMPTMVKDKTSGEQVKNIFSKKFTCHETEEVLGHPWRDKTTGEREEAPQRCGMCKFGDWLWLQIVAWVETHRWEASEDDKKNGKWVERKKGKGTGLDPCSVLFDFISDADKKQNVTMHVGGYCGYFGQKAENLPTDVKKAMARYHIAGSEAWKENSNAKCSYVMCIVDNNDVGKGMQIADETQALGEKVKEVITKTFKSNELNIQKSPYCIEWEYKENEEFSKKYEATALLMKKPNARILKLIRGEAPDLTDLKTPFDQRKMAALFEKICLLKNDEGESLVPWDEIFPDDQQIEKWAAEDAAEEESTADDEGDEEEETSSSDDEEESESAEDDDSEEEEDEQMVKCDNPKCAKPMKLSASECPHCGKKYEVEGEEPESEPEPAKIPTRAELAAAAKNKANGSSKKPEASAKATNSKKKKKEDVSDADEDPDGDAEGPEGNQDDEIPF